MIGTYWWYEGLPNKRGILGGWGSNYGEARHYGIISRKQLPSLPPSFLSIHPMWLELPQTEREGEAEKERWVCDHDFLSFPPSSFFVWYSRKGLYDLERERGLAGWALFGLGWGCTCSTAYSSTRTHTKGGGGSDNVMQATRALNARTLGKWWDGCLFCGGIFGQGGDRESSFFLSGSDGPSLLLIIITLTRRVERELSLHTPSSFFWLLASLCQNRKWIYVLIATYSSMYVKRMNYYISVTWLTCLQGERAW